MADVATVSSQWGDLPLWNLTDLYESPNCATFAGDLERLSTYATDFSADYRGKLATIMPMGGLGRAIERYEELADLLGRIGSYAGLLHMEDVLNVAHKAFYGDMQSRLTQIHSTILFFELELNALSDTAACPRRPEGRGGHS